MTTNNEQLTSVSLPSDREIALSRIFDAPRALVWKAWTDSYHIAQWFGPKGWTLPVSNMDFRPGGVWVYCMRGPNGEESCGKAEYQEIVEPERFVYMDYFADADGNPIEGMPASQVTVEFAEEDGRTRLTSTTLYASVEDRDRILQMGVVEGISETLDCLEEYLGSM